MMLKPAQLRQALSASVPLLQNNPDNLHIFIDNGRILSTLAPSLSFEYQYQLNMVITDYTGDADLIMVPVLAWLRENQSDIMTTEHKRQTGFTFKVDVLSDALSDISIDLQLTERVIVKENDGALHVDHVPEPPLPENITRPMALYLHKELVSRWHE